MCFLEVLVLVRLGAPRKMTAGLSLNVVAVMRTEASGMQLDEECTEMNGTRVEAHVGELADIKPDVEIFRNVDVLIIDIDPKDSSQIEALENIVKSRFPNVPVVGTAPAVCAFSMSNNRWPTACPAYAAGWSSAKAH